MKSSSRALLKVLVALVINQGLKDQEPDHRAQFHLGKFVESMETLRDKINIEPRLVIDIKMMVECLRLFPGVEVNGDIIGVDCRDESNLHELKQIVLDSVVEFATSSMPLDDVKDANIIVTNNELRSGGNHQITSDQHADKMEIVDAIMVDEDPNKPAEDEVKVIELVEDTNRVPFDDAKQEEPQSTDKNSNPVKEDKTHSANMTPTTQPDEDKAQDEEAGLARDESVDATLDTPKESVNEPKKEPEVLADQELVQNEIKPDVTETKPDENEDDSNMNSKQGGFNDSIRSSESPEPEEEPKKNDDVPHDNAADEDAKMEIDKGDTSHQIDAKITEDRVDVTDKPDSEPTQNQNKEQMEATKAAEVAGDKSETEGDDNPSQYDKESTKVDDTQLDAHVQNDEVQKSQKSDNEKIEIGEDGQMGDTQVTDVPTADEPMISDQDVPLTTTTENIQKLFSENTPITAMDEDKTNDEGNELSSIIPSEEEVQTESEKAIDDIPQNGTETGITARDPASTQPKVEAESERDTKAEDLDDAEVQTKTTESETVNVKTELKEPEVASRRRKRVHEEEPSDTKPRKQSKTKTDRRELTPAQYKRFQQVSINLIASIQAHRFLSPFLTPVKKAEQAEYRLIVKQPKDLKLLLRLVKQKNPPVYTLVKQLQKDIMLMFANSVMYNRSDDDSLQLVHTMRQDVNESLPMFEEAEDEIRAE